MASSVLQYCPIGKSSKINKGSHRWSYGHIEKQSWGNIAGAHGLINYTDTKAFVGFLKNWPAGKFSGVTLPSYCSRQGGGGGDGARPAQNTEIAAKSLWWLKITIYFSSAMSSMYIIGQCGCVSTDHLDEDQSAIQYPESLKIAIINYLKGYFIL